MMGMLEKAGYKTVVAQASETSLVGKATSLRTDLKLADVKVDDLAGFMLPCMNAGWPDSSETIPPEAPGIVSKAVAAGKPVAAQDFAIAVLWKAGFTKVGMQVRGVVREGSIITSAHCPAWSKTGESDDTPELTQKLIDALALVR